jgi:glycosidase
MKQLRHLTVLFILLLPYWAQAQVVTTNPVFFTENDAVTITYDATQGNGALANFTGNVYIWTGTVTNLSSSNTNWRNVKSPNFGAADPAALMTRSATNPNIYTIRLQPTVRSFYPVPANETILRLGMLFKDAAGTAVGRAANGGDIFIDVNQSAQAVRITQPANTGIPQFVPANTPVAITATSALAANLVLKLNGATVTSTTNTSTISGSVTPVAGYNVVKVTAGTGASAISDSLILVVRPAVTTAALPAGAKEGVTYLPGGTSVILALTAPNKQFVYALGEFNNFQPVNAAFMNKTPDGNMWWVQLNGLTAGQEYAYQYFVDGALHVADPYTEKILDPNNDQYVPAVTFPGLRYPVGQTGIMATFQTNQTAYNWQTTNFARPAKANLVVYELHLRDFIARHDFQTLQDSLNYLQKLGVNCIELMPVNEFEGNDSWGYNPSFYFAVDKYYGTKNALKSLIDEAHRRGMAVVLDMVLNHSCGASPMVQLYFDNGNPATNSPWFNRTATHPFNVCYDFNHESAFTKAFAKNVMDFWVNEFRVDGYRFDLSKGFTQTNSGSNVALWGNYDQSRINIWNEYNNHIQANRAGTYVILEHFADNSEETVLSNAGMMLWGNMAGAYDQNGQGRNTNLSYGYYGNRGWQQPGLVTFMESHDEERNMFDALTYGLNNGAGYNIMNLNTALDRMGMNTAFFLPIPGPKMIWQFGELGYDISINQNGRTGAKPILWSYYQDPARRKLHDIYANLIALRKQPAFTSGTFTYQLGSQSKVMHITDASLNVTVVGNFGIFGDQINPNFQATGRWYNYLTGDSITVANTQAALTLAPGEYAVYTDRRVTRTVLGTRAGQEVTNIFRLSAAPNPASTTATLYYELPQAAGVQVSVCNMLGQNVLTLPATRETPGQHSTVLPLNGLAAGMYMVRLQSGSRQQITRLVITK